MQAQPSGLYAVFGHPVGHSLSPLIHNHGFSQAKWRAFYVSVECAVEELPDKLAAFRLLGGHGLNLTRPLKEAVLPLIGEADDWVERSGAANTLVAAPNGWRAANTDCEALFRRVKPYAGKNRAALILGSGGVARASAAVLRAHGFWVAGAAKRPERCDWAEETLRWSDRLESGPWHVVINATPLGQVGETSVGEWPLPGPEGLAIDWVYRPANTGFLQGAKSLGVDTLDGLTLLVDQAALAWPLWFGHEAPLAAMLEAVQPWR